MWQDGDWHWIWGEECGDKERRNKGGSARRWRNCYCHVVGADWRESAGEFCCPYLAGPVLESPEEGGPWESAHSQRMWGVVAGRRAGNQVVHSWWFRLWKLQPLHTGRKGLLKEKAISLVTWKSGLVGTGSRWHTMDWQGMADCPAADSMYTRPRWGVGGSTQKGWTGYRQPQMANTPDTPTDHDNKWQ